MTVDASPPSSHVYERLRRDVVSGHLRPNAVLSEGDLAKELGVSRTPVRDSLNLLAINGLVRLHKRRWIVHEHSLREIRETYEVRAALEGQAALLAATVASVAEIDQLLEEARDPSTRREAPDQLVATNDRFHSLLVQASGNAVLCRAVEAVTNYYFNREVANLYSEEELATAVRQHIDLGEAIAARAPEQARDLAFAHVKDSYEILADKHQRLGRT